MVSDTGSRLAASARDYWQQGQDAVGRFDDRMEGSVRDQPLMAVFVAVGVGIAIGIALTFACPASFPRLKGKD